MQTHNYYTNSELLATANGRLLCDELLQDWLDRWDDFSKIFPLETPDEYFTLLALLGRFKRLPANYYKEKKIQTVFEALTQAASELSDNQIAQAVELFDAAYWLEVLDAISSEWSSGEIEEDTEEEDAFFDDATSMIYDLDDFGSVLAYATKRGIIKFEDSSQWEAFDICTNALCEREEIRLYLCSWLQSLSALIAEDIVDRDYALAYATSYWGDLIEWLVTDERVYRGHPDYVAFVMDEIKRMLTKVSKESVSEGADKPRPLSQRSRLMQRLNLKCSLSMAAATHEEIPLNEKWISPDKQWIAYGMLETPEDAPERYVILMEPSSDEMASKSSEDSWCGGEVRLAGLVRVFDENSEACFDLNELSTASAVMSQEELLASFSCHKPNTDKFITWTYSEE